MKRSIHALSVMLIAASALAQPTLIVEAPQNNSYTSSNRAPNGTSGHTYMRGCFLVLASELGNIPSGTSLTSFGFTLNSGLPSTAVTGNFTLYLQNTTDNSYLKGTTYSSAISGMTQVYASALTIPSASGTASVIVTLSSPFTYGGNGMYVAYDWYSGGPFSTTAAVYLCEGVNLPLPAGGGATGASATAAPTSLAVTNFRPSFLWGFANPYSNDMQVLGVESPGKVPAMFNTPHVIKALVKNASSGALSSVSVNLNVTGANTFANTQVIASLAAGASTLLSFAPFNPGLPGANTVSVSVASDQNNSNNSGTYSQSVTCNEWAQNPASGSYTFGAVGFNTGSGILGNLFQNPVTSTLTGMRFAISTNTPAVGNQGWGVLMSTAGVILATTNTITITNGMLGTFQTFSFSVPPQLSASTSYYLGFAQPTGTVGYFPAGTQQSSYLPASIYVSTALTGGTPVVITSNFGYFGIEAVFAPTLTIAAASTTITCGNQATLAASAASNYSWTTGAITQSIVVSPTITTGYGVSTTNTMGCVAAAAPSVVVNPINVQIAASSSVICDGDVAVLNASGASSYTWSTPSGTVAGSSINASPASTATYGLAGNDPNGCANATAITITVNPLPNVNAASSSPSVCLGSSVSLYATGAATYSWSTGSQAQNTSDSPSVTTLYVATGTSSAGCVNTASVTVMVDSFTPGISSSTAICVGQTITLAATGGTTYLWSTGSPFSSIPVSPTVATSYSVTGTGANGCQGTAVAEVSVNPLPQLTVTATRTLMCKGETVTLTVAGASSYTWTNSTSAPSQTVSPPSNLTTQFGVTGTDVNGCSSTGSVSVKVNACAGISEYDNHPVGVFPNPFSDQLMVTLPVGSAFMEVLDGQGRSVFHGNVHNGEKVDLSGLSAGIYLVNVSFEGVSRSARVVKQ